MRIKSGVVKFESGEYATVVFGEPESKDEAGVIPAIQWGDSGVVGDYCAAYGSRVLFVYPCEDKESAKECAGGVAARIMQVVDIEVRMRALEDLLADIRIEEEELNAMRDEIREWVIADE